MSEIAIKFENISKQYRLGVVGTGTISHDLNRWWHLVRGKEDPYLQVGQVNDRSSKAIGDYVWALKDIDFEVRQGEVLGIIGQNGAGKSTLLKILSRVTSPTTGAIKARGRIASLLEVGTGFHPELTGRENIYMNGAIMGMTKTEITRKLDEIVDFAGVEMYIDTPAKRYSSGMTVRLGFAIAAHLEPEILVVDEVLAVGDAEFQKKAIGKMQDVSKGEGRTVLFVSHNMGAVQNLCTRGVILEYGKSIYDANIEQVIDYYLSTSKSIDNVKCIEYEDTLASTDQRIQFTKIEIKNNSLVYGTSIDIELTVKAKETILDLVVGVGISTVTAIRLVTSENLDQTIPKIEKGQTITVKLQMQNINLAPGEYVLAAGMRQLTHEASLCYIPEILSFEVEETPETINISNRPQLGTRPVSTWLYEK